MLVCYSDGSDLSFLFISSVFTHIRKQLQLKQKMLLHLFASVRVKGKNYDKINAIYHMVQEKEQ